MIWLLTAIALADPCPDPAEQLASAEAAFNDAEVALAQDHLDQAFQGVVCTRSPVGNDVLQDLYGFSAVVAYAAGDEASARQALRVLHTVSLAPSNHPYFGPELVEMSAQVAGQLASEPVEITLEQGRRAWVDGELLGAGDAVQVRPGEHLLHASTGEQWLGDWIAVRESVRLDVRQGLDVQAVASAPAAPDVSSRPPLQEPATTTRRRHRAGLLAVGALTAAVGGGAIAYAWQSESRFKSDPYDAASYASCALSDACYADARVSAIQSDASRIRIAYVAGYALTAVGVGVLGAELFILPPPGGRTGGQVGVRGAF